MNSDEKILSALYRAGSDSIFAEKLAQQTGFSNAELVERMAGLIQLGFVIENHPLAGYRLLSSPDLFLADDLRARSEGMRLENGLGNVFKVFQEISSTNDLAHRMALAGYPEGLVVMAESQTAGRGRQGRKWISPPGKGLWFSVLLRPDLPLNCASRLTAMTAVAVATSLRRDTGLPLTIKWPNDILCQGRKLAGILVELSADRGGKIQYAVLGIGIDVNLEKSEFPVELHPSATSLKMEAKKAFHRPTLLVNLLHELDRARGSLQNENFPGLINQWVELDNTLGRQVFLRHGDGEVRGLAVNMDMDGALVIRSDDGRMERFAAGEVQLAESK